ncbi:MAG: transketolase [bacterium]|nr:transketolase [bacterium]
MEDIRYLENKAREIRRTIVEMIYKARSGHIGGSLSSVDILVALYYKVLKINPKNPNWPDRDRFILSKGHSVEGYYAILADLGFIEKKELETYCKFNSRLTGHPTVKLPGVEANTGSLGHGLSIGVGMALAGKMDAKEYKVYVLMGDGEQAEGSIWEAGMSASHYRLDNLVGIIDRNRLQIGGSTESVMSLEDLSDKWKAFGWSVVETDGHNIKELLDVLENIPITPGKPTLIIAHTVKGKGVSFIENKAEWHHRIPTDEEFAKMMEELS